MSDSDERSRSGNPIHRHTERAREAGPPVHPARFLDDVQAHIEEHLGPVGGVFHEIVSDLVHLDVLYVPPTTERPFQVLVTSGVSDEPMTVPAEIEDHELIELAIALPAEWPLSEEAFRDEANYWPVRWLKHIGRLPHTYGTWIGWGHTIPNGDPAEPIADTRFIGFMVAPPYWTQASFFKRKTSSGKTITFYTLVPLFQEEMDLKLEKGADEVERRLQKSGTGLIVDPGRANVAAKSSWWKRLFG